MAKLSIVATPIGNLEDITLRALRTLREAGVVFCEDTRVTRKLFDRYEIGTPLRRLDANTEMKGAEEVIECLKRGDNVAYVTDAGTPTISDPGHRMVARVREELGAEATIEAIPGPSAITAALSISGVPADNFLFLGFLPHKKGRQTMLKKIAETGETVVLYESSHRILKLLEEMHTFIPSRHIIVVREVTKKFEEVQVGTASHLLEGIKQFPERTKGEFVVIIKEA